MAANLCEGSDVSRLPLAEPEQLSGYLSELHDGALDRDWSSRHVARAFAPAPELLEMYLIGLLLPLAHELRGGRGVARLSPRLKELVRLRIATLNGCKTCKAARLAPDYIPEDQALGIDGYEGSADYTRTRRPRSTSPRCSRSSTTRIGDADMATLREHFDDAQILELAMMAGQYIGFGRMLAVLQLETVACPLPERS